MHHAHDECIRTHGISINIILALQAMEKYSRCDMVTAPFDNGMR